MRAPFALALAASILLPGCGAGPTTLVGPAAVEPVDAEEARVRVAIVPSGFRLQAALNPWTLTDVSTVRLQAFRAGGGTAVATKTIAKADLGRAVTLTNLRAGTAYELRATALTAAGADITDADASRTTFTTPAVTTASGVAAIDDTPLAIAVALKLASKAYAGKLVFRISPSETVGNYATGYRVTLSGGDSPVVRTLTRAQAAESRTLTNLKAGTTYTVLTEGFYGGYKITYDARSTYTFRTPALAAGTNDDMNAVLGRSVVGVPCRTYDGYNDDDWRDDDWHDYDWRD
jgi:hypothetical protein